MTDAPGTSGVLYLAIGDDARNLTTLSISFLRRSGYRGPVRVVTDSEQWACEEPGVERVTVPAIQDKWGSRQYKTQLNRFGFPVTLYLDADTLPIAPLDSVWDELRHANICLATDLESKVGSFVDASWEKANVRRNELAYMNTLSLRDFPYFNSGVILWRRCSAVNRLFERWHEEWMRFRNLDQMALVRAFALTGTRVHTLSPVWNCPAGRFPSIESAQRAGTRILHFLSQQRTLLACYVEESRTTDFHRLLIRNTPGARLRRSASGTGARMRVLWITGSFFPRIGGLELFIEKTVESLSELCDVGLVTRRGQWYPGTKPVAHFPLEHRGAANQTEVWQLMAEALQELLPRFAPDIVHFGSARSAACRAVIPEDIITVATVHGNDLTDLHPANSDEEDPTEYVVESLNACDYVFAVSNHTATLVHEWGVTTPMSIFTPGCDLDFFRPRPELGEEARMAWQIPDDVPVILTVSRLAPRKGHLNVLEAIYRLPFRAHWIVVGEGPCADELTEAIAERGMEDQVSMLGAIPDGDLIAIYNACDVFVLTPEERRIGRWLDSEGFGLVLHEAGACGKPVITSALAGCQDAVIDGGTGILVPPSDPARLSDALQRVLTDTTLMRNLGNGGLSLVRISGGWDRLARQTFGKYEELLAWDAEAKEASDGPERRYVARSA